MDDVGDDVGENIRNERRTQPRLTHSEVREIAVSFLRLGEDPEVVEQDTTPCPECDTPIPTGAKTRGRDLDGFQELVEAGAERFSGEFSEDEFREVLREAFDEAVREALDSPRTPDLDRETHVPLDEFSPGADEAEAVETDRPESVFEGGGSP